MLITTSYSLLTFLFFMFVLCSSLWLCLLLWTQQPAGWLLTVISIAGWICFALSLLYFPQYWSKLIYLVVFLMVVGWYYSLAPRQNRDWNPEVAHIFSYEKHGHLVTLHQVRNFHWKPDGSYVARWETRHFDLDKINGVNLVTSYWMGPRIAHTLVSFDFNDQLPLTFSFEIRKERNEKFSMLDGFFRKYELGLIAADEQDIIYTRSNIRHEQMYFFPLQMPEADMQALFLQYLKVSDRLRAQPKWYNSLTSNCTTLVFEMIRSIYPHQFPKDYRLLASGYLPNYLYDIRALDQLWSLQQWYHRAHINPRTAHFEQLPHPTSAQFSRLIRQGLPPSSAIAQDTLKH